MKETARIQTVFRVLKIILSIIRVMLFIGAAAVAVGIVFWCIFGKQYLSGENMKLHYLMQSLDNGGFTSTVLLLITDLIFCIGSFIVFSSAVNYLKKELNDGTPFTQSGARKLRNTGLCCVTVSLTSQALIGVICEIFDLKSAYAVDEATIIVGLLLMLFSAVLRQGEQKKEPTDEKAE